MPGSHSISNLEGKESVCLCACGWGVGREDKINRVKYLHLANLAKDKGMYRICILFVLFYFRSETRSK